MDRTDNVDANDTRVGRSWIEVLPVFSENRELTDNERASYREVEKQLFDELRDDPIYQRLRKLTDDAA